ncbi:glycosyltransferase [Algoriphagus namhaensis]
MPDAVSPPRILIASSLKPVRDTRAWEKFGLSLRETNKYEINIIGFSPKKEEISDKVRFVDSGARVGDDKTRLLALFRFRKLVLETRPHLIICCTVDYLWLAAKLKKKLGFKLIYDVQENYRLNLSLLPGRSMLKRMLWQRLISLSENTDAVDYYFLAEKCYQNQLPEMSPQIVFENKFVGEIRTLFPKKLIQKKGYHFVISGTISETFGTLEGIQFFKNILPKFPFSKLSICGHVTRYSFAKKLEIEAANHPQISLLLDTNPVPHSSILDLIQEADFLLCPYQKHPAFQDKIPSKFFEAQGLGVPVLFTKSFGWEAHFEESKGGFPIDFTDVENQLEQFEAALTQTYFIQVNQWHNHWESDKAMFLALVHHLLQ